MQHSSGSLSKPAPPATVIWWIVGILGVLVVAMASGLAWACVRLYRQNCDQRQKRHFSLSVPFTEQSLMRVTGVVMDGDNAPDRGVSVIASAWRDVHGNVWCNIHAHPLSPWPPTGTVTAFFRDTTTTGRSLRVSVRPSQWDTINRTTEPVMFKAMTPRLEPPPAVSIGGITWRLLQTYRLPFLRVNMHTAHQSFLNMNPGIKSVFYGNKGMRDFVLTHFGQSTLDAVDKLRHGAFKCDLFRLCEIYVYGGMYADVSMVCLQPLDALLAGVDMVLVRDTPARDLSYVHNAFFATRAGCPFLALAIQDIVKQVMSEGYGADPLSITGSGIFGRSLNRFAKRDEATPHALGVSEYAGLRVRMLDNENNSRIKDTERALSMIACKYPNFRKDRAGNPHYWKLWHERNVFLRALEPGERDTAMDSRRRGEAIPRVLLQTWETAYMAPRMLNNVRSSRALHLAAGWGFRFADDAQRRRDLLAIQQQPKTTDGGLVPPPAMLLPRLVEAYDRLLAGGVRAHFWALACLATNGGVYVDSHVVTHQCLDACMNSASGPMTGHIWACEPGCAIYQAALQDAVTAILDCGNRCTRSNDWFRLRAPGHNNVPAGVLLRYAGYDQDRVETGGEDPIAMAKDAHVLVP